jgi:hypothetical protein
MYLRHRVIIIQILLCVLLLNTSAAFAIQSEPRETQLEGALLQQLHPVIAASLKDIYKTQYATFRCERISSINERVTVKNQDKGSVRADAIHGAKYFEITVSLCDVGVNEDDVELHLKNDSSTALYYLVGYKITPKERLSINCGLSP